MQIPNYNKIHNRFLLNGYYYDQKTLKEVAYNFIKEGDIYENYMGDFLLDWLDANDSIYLECSGNNSLNEKKIKVKKQFLVNSAISTGNYFSVTVGDKALHCLPANFIAGKMMLIRAMILGLEIDLISPSKMPFYKNDKSYDFVAMTPIQAFHSLNKLQKVKKLIIGGAYLSNSLQQKLIKLKVKAYETYGMMETLSHIAIREMNDPLSEFKCLPNIEVKTDNRNCLVIDAPKLGIESLVTNDEVEIYSSNHFKLVGRVDHIIKLEDYKIHPEQIERKLSQNLSFHFFIDKIKDSNAIEKLVIVIKDDPEIKIEKLKEQIIGCKSLKDYETPKAVLCFKNFIQTYSGKIKRKETMNQKPNRILDL